MSETLTKALEQIVEQSSALGRVGIKYHADRGVDIREVRLKTIYDLALNALAQYRGVGQERTGR